MAGFKETILTKIFEWAARNLGAIQVCWLCTVGLLGLALLVTTKYAKASSLEDVSEDVADVRLYLLQKDIIDTRVIQCTSVSGQKVWYENRIGELQRKYARLNPTGREYQMPRCEDL